jgi:hypothetical protein
LRRLALRLVAVRAQEDDRIAGLERVLEEIELLSKTEVDASLASYSTQLAQQDTN